MNLLSKKELTAAEEALIESFKEYGQKTFEREDIKQLRSAACQLFAYYGLPTKKVEYWHYTDLRKILQNLPQIMDKERDENVPSLDPISVQYSLLKFHPQKQDWAVQGSLQDLIEIKSFAEEPDNLARFLQKNLPEDEDTIAQINSACIIDGYHVAIKENAKIPQPIEVQHIKETAQNHNGFFLEIGMNAKCCFIERFSSPDKAMFNTAITQVLLKENAELDWIILAEEGEASFDLSQWKADLAQGAKIRLYVVNFSSGMKRLEIKVNLLGAESDFQLRTLNLLGGNSYSDITMNVSHKHAETTSYELLRNVLSDHAKGSFQGIIRVAKDAQKVDAKMACNSLILSDDAEFSAKPELEIFADDVACGHGATMRDLNKDDLFYLMARGIPKKVAKALLIKAFLAEIFDDLDHEHLKDFIMQKIDLWSNRHA